MAQFLCDDLKLQLSNDKTLLTHARTGAARFLGYEITAHHDHSKGARGRRWTDGFMKLNVPRSVVKANTARHMRRGKPAHRSDLVNHDDHTIVATKTGIVAPGMIPNTRNSAGVDANPVVRRSSPTSARVCGAGIKR